MTDTQLYSELASLPSDLKNEVRDFIEFLKAKTTQSTTFNKREFGAAKGFFKMNADFDQPLEDFNEYS